MSIAVFVDRANHLFPIYGKYICLALLLLGANTACRIILCVASFLAVHEAFSVRTKLTTVRVIPNAARWLRGASHSQCFVKQWTICSVRFSLPNLPMTKDLCPVSACVEWLYYIPGVQCWSLLDIASVLDFTRLPRGCAVFLPGPSEGSKRRDFVSDFRFSLYGFWIIIYGSVPA